jgi:hypothetical protein
MNCQHCGATIDPHVPVCPFCRVTTAAGAEQQQRQAQEQEALARWTAAQKHQQDGVTRAKMTSAATQAVVCGAAGLVLCCTPVAVVGIVQGARARSMAASLAAPPPMQATLGLFLSSFAVLSSIGWLSYAGIAGSHDKQATNAEATALEKSVAQQASAPVLAHETACTLAHIHFLRAGHEGTSGPYLDGFECHGKLTSNAERARLEDYRFKRSSTKYEVDVCFKRGDRWYVTEARKGACPGGG